ncbi:endonuclease 8-like 3 [Gadus morhua]|uniref:DNA-(apurinic or apyrimidinic site) lyase n=1 Tax=Gadus morhua TaxID=8049 RepID=A0A8C4ZSA0_GADMO|nr:endonuclease 8-like 3 [Gadus morhua]
MVEGPGVALNGERIRAKVKKGQEVRAVRGVQGAAGALDALRGARFSGVDTLGKELFIYFGLRALRVHFGMNGSMRITSGAPGIKPVAADSKTPVLELHLTDDIIRFYESTSEIRQTEQCESRVSSMRSLDVCSSSFSSSRAEEVLRSQGGRMLCDLLLDQHLLPGVGNIIKNEALFDSGLHPAVTAKQLSEQQLRHLVKMTRDFTLLFYKCRRSGSALSRHYKVYGRPACAQCSTSITVCRLGDGGRMTYFCSHCQSADPSQVSTSKLPVRNSLIGWVTKEGSNEEVATKEEEEWACPRCTLVNRPSAGSCDACLASRPHVPREQSTSSSSSSSSLIKFPCTSFSRPAEELKVNWRSAFGTSTLIFSDLTPPPPSGGGATSLPPGGVRRPAGGGCEQPTNKKMRIDNGRAPGNSDPGYSAPGYGGTPGSSSPGNGRTPGYRAPNYGGTPGNGRTPGYSAPGYGVPPANTSALPAVDGEGAPCCEDHQRPSSLRSVHKDGENKGRSFYCCSLPRPAQCSFFQWADLGFPECGHGRRSVRRAVLKLGANNGRSFYCCGAKKGKQCEFFQWAESSPLPGC